MIIVILLLILVVVIVIVIRSVGFVVVVAVAVAFAQAVAVFVCQSRLLYCCGGGICFDNGTGAGLGASTLRTGRCGRRRHFGCGHVAVYGTRAA